MMTRRVGVLGASSLVGDWLLPLLTTAGWQVEAFSRAVRTNDTAAVRWHPYPVPSMGISDWICVAPVWVLPEHFETLRLNGVRRIVVLSSTSLFTKGDSFDRAEQAVARRLADGEAHLQAWAQEHGIDWIILRPTLIYDMRRDKNVRAIAQMIRRIKCFPLFGAAKGLRQPIHAQDVARACVAALQSPTAVGRAYNISGGEILSYREMVNRVFAAMGRRPRLIRIPLSLFRLAIRLLRIIPACRHWSAGMAERMNRDLVFDHSEAARDLGFSPAGFDPGLGLDGAAVRTPD